MDANRFDTITRLFADRKLSRRQALARGGAGLAAGTLVATGLTAAAARDTTPQAEPDSDHGPSMLFLQSFQSGSVTPKAGEAGTFTLTLEQGLGQTIYFSDRPDRIVGATPTDQFLAGLGFPADNPPNAALVVEVEPGNTDIAVVELFNPVFDPQSPRVTYDVRVLKEWEETLDMEFSEVQTDLAELASSFGPAHLFIDDCPDATMTCNTYDAQGHATTVGTIDNSEHDGYCYNWGAAGCYPCSPWFSGYSGRDEATRYWNAQCNERFEACNGACGADPVCSKGIAATCTSA
jgi:hypothetical protein